LASGILPGIVARIYSAGRNCVGKDAGVTDGRHVVQGMTPAMDFAAVKGLLVLIVIRLSMEFEPVNRRSVKDRDVGELNRDKYNHPKQ
tara:strand:+ start:2150 stop:2413 length:264 start_codon:yes stop_codon:yes gene_type:complete